VIDDALDDRFRTYVEKRFKTRPGTISLCFNDAIELYLNVNEPLLATQHKEQQQAAEAIATTPTAE